jgi:L-serine dehydratase
MEKYREGIEQAGITITVNYLSYGAKHPNNYRIKIFNSTTYHTVQAISTGGGMIEVQEIDGAKVCMNGDYHELLIFGNDLEAIQAIIPGDLDFDFIELHEGDRKFIEIKSGIGFSEDVIKTLESNTSVDFVRYLKPVLPVLSRKNLEVPFLYCDDMLKYGKANDLTLWELAVLYECARGNVDEATVFEKMKHIVRLMKESIHKGLEGTKYQDRILPVQSLGFKEKMENNALLNGGMLNTIILYVTAMMEMKSSMGIIVAAPTAGSCGALPGTLLGAGEIMKKSEEELIKAMLAAGMIGVFISEHSTFAAEVGGCQAECGAGSSMAAAGLVTLAGGTLEQCVTAASIALQNSLGMICDPIANRVEAPCLGKNIMASSNALSCANIALANYDPVVTFDEVVATMFDVGNSMPHELRCTGLGGLAATASSKAIQERLNKFKYC